MFEFCKWPWSPIDSLKSTKFYKFNSSLHEFSFVYLIVPSEGFSVFMLGSVFPCKRLFLFVYAVFISHLELCVFVLSLNFHLLAFGVFELALNVYVLAFGGLMLLTFDCFLLVFCSLPRV